MEAACALQHELALTQINGRLRRRVQAQMPGRRSGEDCGV